PATVDRPQTVTTLRTLKMFHALTLQGKLNAYDFWCGLVRITDRMGTRNTKYRYKEFIQSVHCSRHLRAAKRAGRAHDPSGIEGTQQGELVVECPLCPHPGRNMPEGWEDTPEDKMWKHGMFVAVDANFKLKLKNRHQSLWGLSDVELSPGWAYFVNSAEYAAFLEDYVDEPEVKYCDSNHNAIKDANVPGQKRFIVNGVSAVVCSRHYFYLRHCIGDLQFSERYSSMTYVLLSSITMNCQELNSFFISYNIACSFSKNFSKRMENFPGRLQLDLSALRMKWAIPKFHLLAHGSNCQSPYSYNLMYGVGRTHGEGIETRWSDLNGAALSTREMAGAARHEILDDVLSAINWRKVIGIGAQVKKSLKAACEARYKQKLSLDDLTLTIPAETQDEWIAMMDAYKNNKKAPNPYEEPVTTTSQNDVRLELAEEEAAEARQGRMSLHETTASVFLTVGLELEDQQRLLLEKQPSTRGTTAEKASFREKQNILGRRIAGWRQIQQLYMPCLSQLVAESTSDESGSADTDNPQTTKLYLPSQLPEELRASGCVSGLVDKELRLRRAQAEDSLHQVRRTIRMRLGMIHYKHVHVDGPGQEAVTRARSVISGISEKLRRHVRRYRAARVALTSLSPDGDWQVHLRVLNEEDIRSARQDEKKLGEGHRELSWIWCVLKPEARDLPNADEETTEEEVNDSVQVDFCTTKARFDRWDEEIEHLTEEMPRAVRFFYDRAKWWRSRVNQRVDTSPDINSGLTAFALRQAAQLEQLADYFIQMWTPVLNGLNLSIDWPTLEATGDRDVQVAGDTAQPVPEDDEQQSSGSETDSDDVEASGPGETTDTDREGTVSIYNGDLDDIM
ncbi:hypothetical protein BV25DRAFT_1816493, partial [Artomyces pyxidatus]